MQRFFAFVCLLILVFSVVTSCNEEVGTAFVDKVESTIAAPDFSPLKSSSLTEEELVKLAVDYILFVRENLVKGGRTSFLTEKGLNSLRDAKSDQELKHAITSLGGDGENIVKSFPDYRRLAKSMADQQLDAARVSKLIARRVTERVYQERFGSAKMPDCAGSCSQQFNIDMESCENELALEIGASLVAGAISGGMAGAGGLVISVGMYFNCELTAFMTFDVCSMNCGMN